MKRIVIALAPLWLAASAAPANAQLEAALDLGYDHTFTWRGLVRVTRPNVQPAASIALKSTDLLLSAGAWTLLEPFQPRSRDLTLAGPDALVGQLEFWAEGRQRLHLPAPVEATAGVLRRTYPADAGAVSPASRAAATELLAGLLVGGRGASGWPRRLPVALAANAAFDLGPVGGTYLEAGLVADLPVLFVGEPLGSVIFRLTSGWSWHQETSAPEGGYYAGEGLTHIALGAEATAFHSVLSLPATLHLSGTAQYGVDDATLRRGDPNDPARWNAWLHVTLSLLYPLRRRE